MARPSQKQTIQCKYFSWKIWPRGNVYYADGRFAVHKGVKYDLKKHSLSAKTWEEARRMLDKLDEHIAIKVGLIKIDEEAPTGDISISEGWRLYMERCAQPEFLDGVGEGTLKRYRPVQHRHVEYCASQGITSWSEINRKTTLAYGSWMASLKQKRDKSKKKYAAATIVLELNLICSISKWLVEEKWLPPMCEFKLKLSKPAGTDTHCYTRDQVTRMIAFCRQQSGLMWLMNVIIALATTGLRIGELAKLRWSDFDFASNTLRLTDERWSRRRTEMGVARKIKDKASRTLPLHRSLRTVLHNLEHSKDGLVFHGPVGEKLESANVLDALQDDVIEFLKQEFPTPPAEVIGFADGTTHSLRHYFVSEAFRHGATDAELLAWMGHSDSKILALYRHLRPEDGQRRMDTIDFLGDGIGPASV